MPAHRVSTPIPNRNRILYSARRGLRHVDVYQDDAGRMMLALDDGVLSREEGITPLVAAHRASMLAEALAYLNVRENGDGLDDWPPNDETARRPNGSAGP